MASRRHPRNRGALCVVAVLGFAVIVAGCGARAMPKTSLTILAINENVGRSLFHLDCQPARGDLPNVVAACAALASSPSIVTAPQPFVCRGGPDSWWDVTIAGRFDGEALHRFFSTCWTPQMTTIKRLGLSNSLQQHLEPRRIEAVAAGTRETFPVGLLRPGDAVSCDVRGMRLVAGIATGLAGQTVGTSDTRLAVKGNPDGSVTGDCR